MSWKTWSIVIVFILAIVVLLALVLSYLGTTLVSSSVPTLITATLAVYGAALGTYNLLLKRRENIADLRVTVNMGFMAIGRNLSNPHISLERANTGMRSLSLNPRYFLLPEDKKLTPDRFGGWESSPDFPCRLEPGDRIITWKDMKQVAEGMKKNGYAGKVKLIAAYGDALGNVYKSKPRVLDIDLWTK